MYIHGLTRDIDVPILPPMPRMTRRTKRTPKKPIANEVRVPMLVKRAVWLRDGGKCVYCGSGRALTVDHVIPRRMGGSNDPTNLVTACHEHNSLRGACPIKFWAMWFEEETGVPAVITLTRVIEATHRRVPVIVKHKR